MKISALFYVFITMLALVLLTIMAAMDVPFIWVFYITCLGQFLLLVMVHKLLRDDYTTTKTFDDFYEDHSI